MGTQATPTPEVLLTRFIIFEPSDDTLLNWKIVGEKTARDRQRAAKLFYGPAEPPLHVAVSENAWRPKRPRDVQMPALPQTRHEPASDDEVLPPDGADDA